MARILLGCGASAALHRACDLASRLTQAGNEVRTALTPRAARLIDPQLFEALTGDGAWQDEFGPSRRGGMDHITLSEWAELLLVAPATADLVSRLALGIADDLVTTLALALPAGVPRLIAPAMNPHMLASGPIRRNLDALGEDGWGILDPEEGHMACGIEGKGRLAGVDRILEAVAETLR